MRIVPDGSVERSSSSRRASSSFDHRPGIADKQMTAFRGDHRPRIAIEQLLAERILKLVNTRDICEADIPCRRATTEKFCAS
jgi:hypothetical protein